MVPPAAPPCMRLPTARCSATPPPRRRPTRCRLARCRRRSSPPSSTGADADDRARPPPAPAPTTASAPPAPRPRSHAAAAGSNGHDPHQPPRPDQGSPPLTARSRPSRPATGPTPSGRPRAAARRRAVAARTCAAGAAPAADRFMLIAMVLSVFGARLVQLQGVDAAAVRARRPRRGLVTVELPATRGDDPRPQRPPLADSVDGLMVVADPTLTRTERASRWRRSSRQRLHVDYFTTLTALRSRTAGSPYIARRVPATAGRRRRPAGPGHGLQGPRHPTTTRCAPTPATTSPPTWSASSAPTAPLAGLEQTFNKHARRHRRQRDATRSAGGNRIPLGHNTVDAGRQRHDAAPDHRRGPAVVHPARLARRPSRTPRPTPASRSSWTRTPARSWRWPTTRPTTPNYSDASPERRPRQPRR